MHIAGHQVTNSISHQLVVFISTSLTLNNKILMQMNKNFPLILILSATYETIHGMAKCLILMLQLL